MLSFLTYSDTAFFNELIIRTSGAAYSMWQVIVIGISASDRKREKRKQVKKKNVNYS